MIEQREVLGVSPEERDRVAVDIAHHELGVILGQAGAPSAAAGDEAAVFDSREGIHAGGAVGTPIEFLGETLMAVVDAVDIG